jgi:hypothetical protein
MFILSTIITSNLNRYYPPVTSMDAPFTYELLSDARKAMTSATSAIQIIEIVIIMTMAMRIKTVTTIMR